MNRPAPRTVRDSSRLRRGIRRHASGSADRRRCAPLCCGAALRAQSGGHGSQQRVPDPSAGAKDASRHTWGLRPPSLRPPAPAGLPWWWPPPGLRSAKHTLRDVQHEDSPDRASEGPAPPWCGPLQAGTCSAVSRTTMKISSTATIACRIVSPVSPIGMSRSKGWSMLIGRAPRLYGPPPSAAVACGGPVRVP